MPDDHRESESESQTGVATKQAQKPSPKRASTLAPVDVLPPWRVLLHNDEHSEMGFVVETICMLTPLTQTRALERMLTAHTQGLAVLMHTHKERAELYQDQFQSRGLKVTIEPAGRSG